MGRRKRGPISKKIRHLCYDLKNGSINDSTFKDEIQAIINEYGERGYILQGIGMAIQKWCKGNKRVWRLADEVDVRIRRLFENWVEKMMH